MDANSSPGDYFDKARSIAVAGMLAAAAVAVLGAFLDWITVSDLPPILPADQMDRARSVSGIDTGDGWWVILFSVLLLNGALLLWIRRNNTWAWLGFVSSVVMGGITIADYRAIAEDGSELLMELEVIGKFDHGIGILFALAGALLGVIFSLIGIAASPYRPPTT